MSYTIPTDMIVSGVRRAKLELPNNRYTGRLDQRQDYWKVSVRWARIPNRSLDLWFRDEPDARRLAIKGVVPLNQLMLLLSPFGYKFVSTELGKDPKASVPNPYTDRVSVAPKWHAVMWCEQDGRYADLWYGETEADQAQAGMWAPNMAYGPLDLLRVFNILVVVYPAAEYVREHSLGGFIDANGYHRPGVYPHGKYPAGIELGAIINLEAPTAILGRRVLVQSKAQLQKLAAAQGVPGWLVVEVFG